MAVVFSADFPGGVGWRWLRLVNLHTWWMLRNCVACVRGHMLDATPQCIMMGWGGVGWGWLRSVNLHTWWMLRNCVACVRGHMLDATPQCIMMGWGWLRSVNLHTWSMLRNFCAISAMHTWSITQLGRTRKVAVTKRKRPTVLLIVHGVKTCQVQVVSDFGKTPKVPVLPRRNARF